MRTIDKINAISQELFKCNFIFLNEQEQDEVSTHYLCEQDEMYTQLWRDSLTQEQIESI
jgi:hypothetical protein